MAADAGKSVRGAAAADDTRGAGAEEPVHVAPAAFVQGQVHGLFFSNHYIYWFDLKET